MSDDEAPPESFHRTGEPAAGGQQGSIYEIQYEHERGEKSSGRPPPKGDAPGTIHIRNPIVVTPVKEPIDLTCCQLDGRCKFCAGKAPPPPKQPAVVRRRRRRPPEKEPETKPPVDVVDVNAIVPSDDDIHSPSNELVVSNFASITAIILNQQPEEQPPPPPPPDQSPPPRMPTVEEETEIYYDDDDDDGDAAFVWDEYDVPEVRSRYERRPTVRSNPIVVTELRRYCENYLWSCGNRALDGEFGRLPDGLTDVVRTALLPANVALNRSLNAVPYERNRVRLGRGRFAIDAANDDGGSGSSSYINASVVRTLGCRRCVVTQCPTTATIDAFWQMVWERCTGVIVMLMSDDELERNCRTAAADLGNVGAGLYWHEAVGQAACFGYATVELVAVSRTAAYIVREFRVEKVGEPAGGAGGGGRTGAEAGPVAAGSAPTRTFLHFQFSAWSAGGLPLHPIAFLGFVRRVRAERCTDTGYVVHCRTGGGRSGVFVAVDTLLTQGYGTGVVDVFKCVAALRLQRADAVRLMKQYCFVYECLTEEFDHGATYFAVDRFCDEYERKQQAEQCCCPVVVGGGGVAGIGGVESASFSFPREYRLVFLPYYIASAGNLPPAAAVKTACGQGTTTTTSRRRRCERSPSNVDAATLMLSGIEELEEFDAAPGVYLDSFRRRDAFVVSRCLSRSCVVDFWELVVAANITCVVVLNKICHLHRAAATAAAAATGTGESTTADEDSGGGRIFPTSPGETLVYAPYTILCRTVRAHPDGFFLAYNLTVTRNGGGGACSAAPCSRCVRLYEFVAWSASVDVPAVCAALELVNQLRRWQARFGAQQPAFVFGSVGPAKYRAALLVALWTLLEQAEEEGFVDVFAAARLVRTFVATAVSTLVGGHLVDSLLSHRYSIMVVCRNSGRY